MIYAEKYSNLPLQRKMQVAKVFKAEAESVFRVQTKCLLIWMGVLRQADFEILIDEAADTVDLNRVDFPTLKALIKIILIKKKEVSND